MFEQQQLGVRAVYLGVDGPAEGGDGGAWWANQYGLVAGTEL